VNFFFRGEGRYFPLTKEGERGRPFVGTRRTSETPEQIENSKRKKTPTKKHL